MDGMNQVAKNNRDRFIAGVVVISLPALSHLDRGEGRVLTQDLRHRAAFAAPLRDLPVGAIHQLRSLGAPRPQARAGAPASIEVHRAPKSQEEEGLAALAIEESVVVDEAIVVLLN